MKTLIIGILAIMALVAETILTAGSVGIYFILAEEAYPLTTYLVEKL